MKNPLKGFLNIHKGEWTLAISMFLYFFFVITTFWVLKPIKKSLFISYYDSIGGFDLLGWFMSASQAELLAKVLNMAVAFAAVAAFTLLARRFHRQRLTYVISGFLVAAFISYTGVVNQPASWVVWSFYLFGDLYSTLMVATFFAFLNDSVKPEAAKRLYGLIVLGGVSGGVFGTMGVRVWIDRLDNSAWLWVCLTLAIVIVAAAAVAGREVDRRESFRDVSDTTAELSTAKKANAAVEGARLVLRSKYLLAVVGIVGLYEIASTVLDFQFTATIAHYLDGPDIGDQFATVFLITNLTSMVVQLFLTSWIMTRFGVKRALLILPIAMLVFSLGYMALPILWMGSLLNTADNGLSYSVNQSAKETLYTPTTRDEKYKAKAFIDMFVQRFAKAIAVGVSLAITTIFSEEVDGHAVLDFAGLRWLSVFTVLIIVAWLYAVRYAGNRFDERTRQ